MGQDHVSMCVEEKFGGAHGMCMTLHSQSVSAAAAMVGFPGKRAPKGISHAPFACPGTA
jgi:hypothetical protein